MAREYHRNAARRAVNAFGRFMIGRGLAAGNARVLTVKGRKSGAMYSTPVTVVELDGSRYLVAPYGEVAWVKNARVAGTVILSHGRLMEEFAIEPVDGFEAGRALKAYLSIEKVTRPYFEVKTDADEQAFASIVGAHPVFRLVAFADGLR
jgi:deazaflavin-dependent oxidoreductase (nitroreductase family)